MKILRKRILTMIAAAVVGIGLTGVTGCERKEKVLEIETPRGEVEVERDLDDGDVDVTIDER